MLRNLRDKIVKSRKATHPWKLFASGKFASRRSTELIIRLQP